MLRVGLTGGLATGKTFVGRALESHGCHLLQANATGRAALEPDGAAYPAVAEAFGTAILDEHSRIDRRRLAALVFSDPAQLERLNALIHPVVIAHEEQWFREIESLDPRAIGVVEAYSDRNGKLPALL